MQILTFITIFKFQIQFGRIADHLIDLVDLCLMNYHAKSQASRLKIDSDGWQVFSCKKGVKRPQRTYQSSLELATIRLACTFISRGVEMVK